MIMWLSVALVSAIFHIGYTVIHDSADRGGDPMVSVLAETVLLLVFLVLFVSFWKFYCIEWKRLSKRSLMELLAEKLWLPVVAVFLVSEPRYFAPEKPTITLVFSGAVLFFALMDWDLSIERRVEAMLAERTATDRRLLYSHFPPKTRGDLLPMDLIINLATAAMIVKKLT